MRLQHQNKLKVWQQIFFVCFFSKLKSRNNPNSIRKSSSNTNIGASQRATIKSSLNWKGGESLKREGRNVLSATLPPVHKENTELGCEIQENLNRVG